jgi:beta-alanine degradation protein BauB
MRLVPLACILSVLAVVPSAAQDPVKVASQYYRVVAENERVRVLRVNMPPGGDAAMHSHPAHLAVSLDDITVHMTLPDGKTQEAPLKAGEARMQPAGTHATANKGTAPMEVIVIEMKGEPGTPTLPSSRPGMKMTRIFQDARAEAYRVAIDSTFHEPAGTKHDYDQVVITLAPGDVALTMDGKTTSTWKRGDVTLIGRGVPHQTQGGKMAGDMIIVTIK